MGETPPPWSRMRIERNGARVVRPEDDAIVMITGGKDLVGELPCNFW